MVRAKSTHVVTAVFREQADAMRAYEWLRQHGYGLEEINVLLPGSRKGEFHDQEHDDIVEMKTRPPAGAERRALIGALIGCGFFALIILAITYWLTLYGFLGQHPGPAALAATGAGAMFGGLIGGLIGYGFPERSAREYESLLQAGGIAIGVTPHSAIDELVIASEFQELHGEKIIGGKQASTV